MCAVLSCNSFAFATFSSLLRFEYAPVMVTINSGKLKQIILDNFYSHSFWSS